MLKLRNFIHDTSNAYIDSGFSQPSYICGWKQWYSAFRDATVIMYGRNNGAYRISLWYDAVGANEQLDEIVIYNCYGKHGINIALQPTDIQCNLQCATRHKRNPLEVQHSMRCIIKVNRYTARSISRVRIGEKHGYTFLYNRMSDLTQAIQYRYDAIHGKSIDYYASGTIKKLVNYSQNKKQGAHYDYHLDGNPTRIHYYNEGCNIATRQFLSDSPYAVQRRALYAEQKRIRNTIRRVR